MAEEDLRYPIGRFHYHGPGTSQQRAERIEQLAAQPAALRAAVGDLTAEQLGTPYRQGGWTVRQLVHHIPDSHLNAYCRVKLALTEEEPTIKPYDEAAWAELADSRLTPVEVSLALLEAVHRRLVTLLRALPDADFARRFRHPDHEGVLTVDWILALYAWHGAHHIAHITSLATRMGWRRQS
jgi:hypothetical protein